MLKLILKTSFYSVKNNHWRSINFIEMGQNNHSRHSYRFLLIILNPAVFFLLTEFPLHISPPGLRRIKLNISSPPPPHLWPVEHQSRAGKYERRIIQTVISLQFEWLVPGEEDSPQYLSRSRLLIADVSILVEPVICDKRQMMRF